MNTRPKRPKPTSRKSKEWLFVLWLLLGWFGVHRFYTNNVTLGLMYLLLNFVSCGILGIVPWLDGLMQVLGTPKDEHGLAIVWSFRRGKLVVDPLEEGTFEPPEAALRIAVNVGLIFLLPYLVGSAGLAMFETSQVRNTAGSLLGISLLFLVPIFLIHILGIARKYKKQLRYLRAAQALTLRTRLDALARCSSLITLRGGLVLLTGTAFLTLSLAYKWADLGMIAVLALSAFYLMTALSALVSSFLAGGFSNNILERGGAIHRSFSPGVARAGDPVREVVELKGIPVPPGFFLTLRGDLPPRLATDARHVVLPKPRSQRLSLATAIRRTPRGLYDAPALRVEFTDMLGLTSSSVASLATARLRILPSLRSADVVPPPPSSHEEPDILTRPHRLPTDDLFRFREYSAGDDTRRIHWKLSMRAGKLIVKKPDSRETTARRVIVALDTYVPPDWLNHTVVIDDAMDALVEAWLAIGQRLVEQGEKVTLVLVARGSDGVLRPEAIPCSATNHAKWLDAGSRAEWQAHARVEDVLDYGVTMDQYSAERAGFDSATVVTMRLSPPSPARVARQTTWICLFPEDALGPPPRSQFAEWVDHNGSGTVASAKEVLRRLLFLPHPVGSEENGLWARVKSHEKRTIDRAHKVALHRLTVATGHAAIGALLRLPDAVYRLEVASGRHRVVGLKGASRGGAAQGRSS